MALNKDLRSIIPRRQPINIAALSLVSFAPMAAGDNGLPLVVQPTLSGVSLAEWLGANRAILSPLLHKHGALLFRGFGLKDQADFSKSVDALAMAKMNYIERATPRSELGDQIYTATEFPPEYEIAPHNELSYVNQWPGHICFFCETPAAMGGETPIVDVRRVLARLDPKILEPFRRLGWKLVRNFGDAMGPSWRHSYDVEDRAALEAYCIKSDVSWEWLPNDHLRTSQVRPSIRRHPATGEDLWFNHVAFWHVSSLPREVRERFLSDFGMGMLPYNTYYGDGQTIPDDVVGALRAAYDAELVSYPWQAGDFLIADNMLVAHGRARFSGHRRVLVAMGNPVAISDPIKGAVS